MDEEIYAGRPVSGRVLEAAFPPEPEGMAVAIDHHGVACQRRPSSPYPRREHGAALWLPVPDPDSFDRQPRTWREMHAAGPVVVVWEPSGRDRVDAQALASFQEVRDAAS